MKSLILMLVVTAYSFAGTRQTDSLAVIDLNRNGMGFDKTKPMEEWDFIKIRNNRVVYFSRTLNEIYESVCSLDSLSSLSVKFDSKKVGVPDCLSSLNQLDTVKFLNSNLTEIPFILYQMTNLNYLDLSDNDITYISDSIGQLTQLKQLGLNNNKLTHLPDSLWVLNELLGLGLTDNNIDSLSPQIVNMEKLLSISVGKNFGIKVPDLTGLDSLFHLDLAQTGLLELGEWVGNLPSLTSLDLYDNELQNLPLSLGASYKVLSYLELSQNRLRRENMDAFYDARFPKGMHWIDDVDADWPTTQKDVIVNVFSNPKSSISLSEEVSVYTFLGQKVFQGFYGEFKNRASKTLFTGNYVLKYSNKQRVYVVKSE